jgi:lipopolysaccharide transport system permease protein
MSENTKHIHIAPHEGLQPLKLSEIWQYKNLLFNLVKRDLNIQYSNTGLGLFWVIVEPLMLTLILTLVLSIFTRFASKSDIPYSLLVLSGIIPWNYFSRGLTSACESVISNFSIFSKVYLPRIIIPIVPGITGMVNYTILTIIFLVVVLFFGIAPSIKWLYIPILILILFILTLGFSFWLSALNVQFRDIGKLLPLILQIGFYITPVLYLTTLIPADLYKFYTLNPMVGIVSFYRWIFFKGFTFPSMELIITCVFSVVVLVTGAFIFRQLEDKFVDIS